MSERKQIDGDHYNKHTIQPFDIIDDYGLDFYEANALKYLLRHRDKGGIVDLQKAKHYIDEVIRRHYFVRPGEEEASEGGVRTVPSRPGGPIRTDAAPESRE